MYVLYSEDRPSIIPHQCNTIELASKVKEYIESRYPCTIIFNEISGFVYYDAPFALKSIKKELYNINVGPISVRIDDVDMLMDFLKYKEADFTKGFTRIASFKNNICLTEEEYNEARQYVIENEDYLDKCIKEATDIILSKHETLP